jgi:hypothetical protein
MVTFGSISAAVIAFVTSEIADDAVTTNTQLLPLLGVWVASVVNGVVLDVVSWIS